jgi:hypothetical protein
MKKKGKRSKPDYNKKLCYALILLLVLIAASFALKEIIKSLPIEEEECVMQPTSCCSCAMGGNEECMTKKAALILQEALEAECSKGVVCTANYVCENVTCKMVDGTCKKE